MLKKIAIVVLVVAILLLVVGYLLPRTYLICRSSFIEASADKIYASVIDLKSWPEWTPWNEEMDPTIQYTYSGSGVGSVSRWTSDNIGVGYLEVTSTEEGRGIVYELHFEGSAPADGVVQITQMKGGCEVMWKMSGEGVPPIEPYFILMMDWMIGKDFEQCLAGLKERSL